MDRTLRSKTFPGLLRGCRSNFADPERLPQSSVTLARDTSVLWDEFCLIEVCLLWGGRSIALGQEVLKHGSATVGFEQYLLVLEATQKLLPPSCQVTLLADRGFEHWELIPWLRQQGWSWRIRAKVDMNVTLTNGKVEKVGDLKPPPRRSLSFP